MFLGRERGEEPGDGESERGETAPNTESNQRETLHAVSAHWRPDTSAS